MTDKFLVYATSFFVVFSLCNSADVVYVAPPKSIYVSIGSNVSLSWCVPAKLGGFPPNILFYLKGSSTETANDLAIAKLAASSGKITILPSSSLLKSLFSRSQIRVLTPSDCEQNGKNYTLVLRNLSSSQAGIYKFEADYLAKRLGEKNETKIQFYVPPSLSLDLSKMVNVGDRVTLVCNASGVPPPTVQWTKRGSSNILSNAPIWVVSDNISKDWNGTYVCSADDGRGNRASKSIDLFVYYPPIVNILSWVKESFIGEKAIFKCSASGNPRPSYSWITPDQATQYSSKTTNNVNIFEITFTRSADFGSYTCLANNSVGNDTQSMTVKELFAPGKVGPIKNNTFVLSVYLNWSSPSENGGSPILNYSVSVTGAGKSKTDFAQSTEYEIKGLLKNTSYIFCVRALNKVGFGDEKCITTTTLYKGPPERPVLHAIEILSDEEPVKVLVSWNSVGDNVVYILKYHTINSEKDWQSKNLTSLNYTLTKLELGITYTIWVVALNNHGESPSAKTEYSIPIKTAVPTIPSIATEDNSGARSTPTTAEAVPSKAKSEGSSTKTVVIVISVILALLVIIAVVFFVLWMKRRTSEHAGQSETMDQNLYETVDKPNKSKKDDLVYAELSEIAPITGEHKRRAYEPTEYADIAHIIKPNPVNSDGLYENVQSTTKDENTYANINEMDV